MCGITALMRRGTEATWQGSGWPARGVGGTQGADTWEEATRVHADAREGRHVVDGAGSWRAHGIVGSSKIVGAVTRKRYTAPQFILNILQNFFREGLCPTRFLPFAGDVDTRQATWTHDRCRIPSRRWRSRGPESTQSSIKHVREIQYKW